MLPTDPRAARREEALLQPVPSTTTESPMSDNEETKPADAAGAPRTCRVRGRPGLYRVLKVFARRARVVATGHAEETSFLVDNADLRDPGEPDTEPGLFPHHPDEGRGTVRTS